MPIAWIGRGIPNVGIQSLSPVAYVRSYQTGTTGERGVVIGMPIGLLLALTYATNSPGNLHGDLKPNVRITTI